MTVRELIEKLSGLPPDLLVVVNLRKNEFANGAEVCSADVVPAYRWVSDPGGRWHYDYYPENDPDEERRTVVNVTT